MILGGILFIILFLLFICKQRDAQSSKSGALGNSGGIAYDCRVDPSFVGYVTMFIFQFLDMFGCM